MVWVLGLGSFGLGLGLGSCGLLWSCGVCVCACFVRYSLSFRSKEFTVLYDPTCGLHTMSDNQLSALFHDIDAKSLRRDDLCLVCRIYKVSAHLAEHSLGGGNPNPKP